MAPKLLKTLLIFGVVIPLTAYIYDQFIGPGKWPKETPLGLYQSEVKTPKDKSTKINLLDPKTGQLNVQGWAVGGLEENIVVNYKDARPWSSHSQWINKLRYRQWNYYLLHTPKHVIQFNFVDVISGAESQRGVCPSSVIIFDKTNPKGTLRRVEE